MTRTVLTVPVLATLLAVPFACGGRAESPGPQMCQAIAWGGWDGTPACSGIASIVIPSEYRVCRTDADCALVGTTQCSSHAANHQGAAALSQNPMPCSLPAIGHLCQPVQHIPRCDQGCCIPARQ